MKVLLTATVQSHICQFHRPLVEMLHEHGCEVHVADDDTAFLSNDKDTIVFTFRDKIVRFKGPYSLKCFDSVTEWDNGYIVVNVFYDGENKTVEDYIDLIPVLEDLYIDSKAFLSQIKKLEVRNV